MKRVYRYSNRWPVFLGFCLSFIVCLSPLIYYYKLYVPVWLSALSALIFICPIFLYVANKLFLKVIMTEEGLYCKRPFSRVSAPWDEISVLAVEGPSLIFGRGNTLHVSFRDRADVFISDSLINTAAPDVDALREVLRFAEKQDSRISLSHGFFVEKNFKHTNHMNVLVGLMFICIAVFFDWRVALAALMDGLLLGLLLYFSTRRNSYRFESKIAITKTGIFSGWDDMFPVRWSEIKSHRMEEDKIVLETAIQNITIESTDSPEQTLSLYETVRAMTS